MKKLIYLFILLLIGCDKPPIDHVEPALEPFVAEAQYLLDLHCGFKQKAKIIYRVKDLNYVGPSVLGTYSRSGFQAYVNISSDKLFDVPERFGSRRYYTNALIYVIVHEIAHAHGVHRIEPHDIMGARIDLMGMSRKDPYENDALIDLCFTMKEML